MRAKKGTFYHWIVILGIPLVVGIILILSLKPGITSSYKGEWQLNFLKKAYLPAEIELLKIDIAAKEAGLRAALELAAQGGFLEVPPCGSFEEVNLWNKGGEFCFPELDEILKEVFNQKFSEIMAKDTAKDTAKDALPFSEVSFEGYYLYGLGKWINKENFDKKYHWYLYQESFAVDLGYTFEEYNNLREEALSLLNNCRDSQNQNLQACLIENKKENWKDSSCLEEDFKEENKEENKEEKKISFCVLSPSEERVKYKFALDFTPVKRAAPDFKVELIEGKYRLSVKRKALDESYKLYYTNWPGVLRKQGKAREVFSTMPTAEEFGYFYREISFANPLEENCPPEKVSGEAYLCRGEVVYILEDSDLAAGEAYWFGLVPFYKGEELELTEFKKIG